MRFIRILTPSLFASAVLAFGGIFTNNATRDSNWGGALLELEGAGTFQYVSSTIRAPNITGSPLGASGNALIGIDGTSLCPTKMLQVGLLFTMSREGPSYGVAYRFGTENEGFFTNLTIGAGDPIKLLVSAPVDNSTGFVEVHNLNNNKNASQSFNVTPCGKTVEWVVQSLWQEDHDSPLADFGTLTFEDAQAGGKNEYGPLNASTVNIVENGKTWTSVLRHNDSVIVKYL